MKKPTRLRLMTDHFSWPLWLDSGDNIDPRTLPLSPATIEGLDRWASEFDRYLDMNDPANSEWPEDARNEHVLEGRRLWREVRRELGPGYRVVLKLDRFYEPEEDPLE